MPLLPPRSEPRGEEGLDADGVTTPRCFIGVYTALGTFVPTKAEWDQKWQVQGYSQILNSI